MSKHHIRITQDSPRPVGQLFAALADHNKLNKVFMIPVRRIRDGQPDVNGVGSVRRMGPPPLGIEETVTAASTDEFIEYRITRNGGPVRNHKGRLDFAETPQGGSQVVWTIDFEAPLAPIGRALELGLSQAIRMGLKRIA